ncbi:hypothetical protein B0I12_002250 [Microbacterium hydrothermale]|uniref:hypothetical protein n=1 Tax=Microbacterium hydrothermale TaxID=857427 RepID=UPI002225E090|nr:hypothetical protein [Microbacterium hydrothermale]MCW2165095.1 hypothetical protein [Microbacterium hydrothermale]
MSARRTVPAPDVARGSGVVDAIGDTKPRPGVLTILSKSEAERLTQEIKLTASGIRNNLFKLRNQIDTAKSSNVWQMLGFASWTAWLSDTLSEEPMRVSREERLELVEYLAGEGLSARAIAPIVGISKSQAAKDKAEVSTSGHDSPGLPGMADADEDEPMSPAAPAPLAPVVQGLDGKSYPKPNLRPVTLTAITDDARAAGVALRKAIERLDRIREDERFPGYRAQILADMAEHLGYARDVLNDYGVENLLDDTTKEH